MKQRYYERYQNYPAMKTGRRGEGRETLRSLKLVMHLLFALLLSDCAGVLFMPNSIKLNILGFKYQGGIIASYILHRWNSKRRRVEVYGLCDKYRQSYHEFIVGDWNGASNRFGYSAQMMESNRCSSTPSCIGIASNGRSLAHLVILKEEVLFVKHGSSHYCRSLGKITWDIRHLPLFQVTGTALNTIGNACDKVSHCFGFSSNGWLYAAQKVDVSNSEYTQLFVKPAFVRKSIGTGASVYPGMYGLQKQIFTPDYIEWKSRKFQGKTGRSSECAEADVAQRDDNSLLILAWADVYSDQGNALLFLRKMIPDDSILVNVVSGFPVLNRCSKRVTVKSGDSMWSISQTYRVSLGNLMNNNQGKSPQELKPGDVLCIPSAGKMEPEQMILKVTGSDLTTYITLNRFCLPRANAVLYHAPTIYMAPPPFKDRPHGQVWAVLSYESSRYTTDRILEDPTFSGIFQVSATRSKRSNCPMTETMRYDVAGPAPDFTSRLPHILYVYSHCNTASDRDRFALLLNSTLNGPQLAAGRSAIILKSYGRCLHNTDWPNIPGSAGRSAHGWETAKSKLSKMYMFELVAMNSLCESYVDEKLQIALLSGAIPIVLGPPDILEFDIQDVVKFGPSAFIAVQYLPSVRSLAEHLSEIIRNEKLYRSYHYWRIKFRKPVLRNPSPLFDGREGERTTLAFHCLFETIRNASTAGKATRGIGGGGIAPEQCTGNYLHLWWTTWRSRILSTGDRLLYVSVRDAHHQYCLKGKVDDNDCCHVLDSASNNIVKIRMESVTQQRPFIKDDSSIDRLSWEDKMHIATIIADVDYMWKIDRNIKVLYSR